MHFSTFKFVFLTTNLLLYLLVISTVGFVLYARKREYYRTAWHQIRSKQMAMVCLGIVSLYAVCALLDSVHFQRRAYAEDGRPLVSNNGQPIYQAEILSLLDGLFNRLSSRTEKTFSAPFATHQFVKEYVEGPDGKRIRDFPKLKYGGSHLSPLADKSTDIASLILKGLLLGLGLGGLGVGLTVATPLVYRRLSQKPSELSRAYTGLKTGLFLGTVIFLIALVGELSTKYHVLGTD